MSFISDHLRHADCLTRAKLFEQLANCDDPDIDRLASHLFTALKLIDPEPCMEPDSLVKLHIDYEQLVEDHDELERSVQELMQKAESALSNSEDFEKQLYKLQDRYDARERELDEAATQISELEDRLEQEVSALSSELDCWKEDFSVLMEENDYLRRAYVHSVDGASFVP